MAKGPASGPRHPTWASFDHFPPNGDNPPVDPRSGERVVAFIDGRYWAAIVGSPHVIQRGFVSVTLAEWAEVRRYQDAAPGGRNGPVALGYSCVWRLLVVTLPPKRRTRPAGRKTWATLAESTKRGYRGPLRQMGLRTEAEFAQYYENATDLTVLRRHTPKDRILTAAGAFRLAKGSDDDPYLITWQAK